MNNDEAKFLLRAYRPGGRDAADPAFAGALAQARSDPRLGAWFAREQAFDGAVADKLCAVAPPPGLREAILAGASVSHVARPARRWPVWLAVAAGVALLFGAGLWRFKTAAAPMDPLMAFALHDVRFEQHGGHGGPAAALQQVLQNPATRLTAGLPVDLAALRATGCRTLNFGGHHVMEICFQRGSVLFHLYMARRADFPQIAAAAGPSFGEKFGCCAAQWADARHVFVVATEADPAALRALL
ncbi:MAG TPA: hypothetical protein VMI53_00775 [Opitutaceae bacterium]|nr:hypothetical protein [Opitutaceae bacterium]